jgi:hypothetical protein
MALRPHSAILGWLLACGLLVAGGCAASDPVADVTASGAVENPSEEPPTCPNGRAGPPAAIDFIHHFEAGELPEMVRASDAVVLGVAVDLRRGPARRNKLGSWQTRELRVRTTEVLSGEAPAELVLGYGRWEVEREVEHLGERFRAYYGPDILRVGDQVLLFVIAESPADLRRLRAASGRPDAYPDGFFAPVNDQGIYVVADPHVRDTCRSDALVREIEALDLATVRRMVAAAA